MKKKKLLLIVGVLLLIFFVLQRTMTPAETLQVGTQVSEMTFQFTKEIKDKEKITAYETWFDEIEFSEEVEGLDQDGDADIIVQVRRYKEGTSTHPVSVWVAEDNITVINNIGTGTSIAKISQSTLDDLQHIIE